MEKSEMEALLDDYFSLPPRSGDPELAAVDAALFLEQTFGIRVPEEAISPERLGSPEAVRKAVLEGAGIE